MSNALLTALFLPLGFAVGALHFANLAANLRLLATGGSAWRAGGLLLLRFGLSAGLLVAAVQFGAWPLIGALAGWLAARFWRQRVESF